jgi:hypothetical protein
MIVLPLQLFLDTNLGINAFGLPCSYARQECKGDIEGYPLPFPRRTGMIKMTPEGFVIDPERRGRAYEGKSFQGVVKTVEFTSTTIPALPFMEMTVEKYGNNHPVTVALEERLALEQRG